MRRLADQVENVFNEEEVNRVYLCKVLSAPAAKSQCYHLGCHQTSPDEVLKLRMQYAPNCHTCRLLLDCHPSLQRLAARWSELTWHYVAGW